MRKHVKANVSWVGYIDWELKHFHGDEYSIINGSSQNAYLVEEEKTGSSTFDVEFNPFDCMADYGLFQNLHKEVTACECQ